MIIKLLRSIENSGSTQMNQTTNKSVIHRISISMRMRMHTHFSAC